MGCSTCCTPECMKFSGAAMYVIGFVAAGIAFIMVGVQYDKTPADFHDVHYDCWVYAWALTVAAVGIILETEQVFCGDETHRNVGYFAGLFELVGIFGMGAFGFGLAVYFSNVKNDSDDTILEYAPDRRDISAMIAVSSIVYLLGAVLVVVDLICKEKFFSSVRSILSFFNMLMCILLTIMWFLFASAMVSTKKNADRHAREYAFVIGIVLILTGLAGFLKCIGAVRD